MDNFTQINRSSVLTTPTTPMLPLQAEPPKPSKLPLLLMTLLFFVSTAIAIYFYLQTKLPPQSAQVLASPTPVASPDPTADWDTYVNKEYGFSFKYPLDWSSEESKDASNNKWTSRAVVQILSRGAAVNHGEVSNGTYLVISVTKPDSNFSNLEEYKNYSQELFKRQYTPKMANKLTGYLYTSGNQESGFIFFSNNLLFQLTYMTSEPTNNLDQILSTFKFVSLAKLNEPCAGKENILCGDGLACKLTVVGDISQGGKCVDEAETNP